MKIRDKKTGTEAEADEFNLHSMGEIIVCYEDDIDSDFIRDFDVFIETGPRAGQWIDLKEAFRNHDVIPDNYHRNFREPKNCLDRIVGYEGHGFTSLADLKECDKQLDKVFGSDLLDKGT